jgi:hypothetical protein
MADRSQHVEQIMENQTRYDLNAAIESWRQELAAQANLTAEVRRELETHLRDAIVGFQQRGLNDEESFWLARRRIGQPKQLGEEFVKADPTKVWRERVFWMAVGIWTSVVVFCVIIPAEWIFISLTGLKLFFWKYSVAIFAVQFVPLAWLLSAGKLNSFLGIFSSNYNRLRLAAAYCFTMALALFFDEILRNENGYWIAGAWESFQHFSFLIIGLLTLLLWAVPQANVKIVRRA